jgi:hypothetical protein
MIHRLGRGVNGSRRGSQISRGKKALFVFVYIIYENTSNGYKVDKEVIM